MTATVIDPERSIHLATIPRRDPDLGVHIWRARRLRREYCYLHRHPELEIAVCPSDRGSYMIEHQEYAIAPGDVFIVNTNDFHQPILDREDNDGALVAYFTPDVFGDAEAGRDWLVPFVLAGYLRQNCLREMPRVRELLEELVIAYASERPHWQVVCRGVLAHILALIVQRHRELASQEHGGQRWSEVRRFAEVIEFINGHLDQPIEGRRVYRMAGLSRTQFCSRFKAVFGVSMAGYVQRQRVQRATRLLRSTDMTITEICQLCGFNWLGYFNTTFRRHTGMSPTAYRRNVRPASSEPLRLE